MKIFILIVLIISALFGIDSSALREEVLSKGMGTIPKDFEQLKLLVDKNPNNPLSVEKIQLGRKLFFDANLSKSRKISCATCHDRAKGGADARPTAIGHEGLKNPAHLNTPTVFNTALASQYFWDGRSHSLENQAQGPSQAPFEMASTPELIEKRVKEKSEYITLFNALNTPINFKTVTQMIASYEKILVTPSAYDAFLEGDDNAMNESAKEGLKLFMDIGCKGCHTGIGVGGFKLQKFPLRDYNSWLNIMFEYKNGSRHTKEFALNFKPYHDFPFKNVGGFKGKGNTKYFRVPILRNVTKTAPYFHNGAVKELREVIFLMGRHQVGVDLTEKQIDKIEAFLKSLEAPVYEYGI